MCRKFLTTPGKAAAAARAALPIATCACSIFTCPDIGMAASAWRFQLVNRCWCMRLHVGAVQTAWECLLWEKNPLLHKGIEHQSVLHLALRSDAVPTELSHPDNGSFPRQKDDCNYRISAHVELLINNKSWKFIVINRYFCTYDEILKLWVALSIMVGTSALKLMSCFKMWAENHADRDWWCWR